MIGRLLSRLGFLLPLLLVFASLTAPLHALDEPSAEAEAEAEAENIVAAKSDVQVGGEIGAQPDEVAVPQNDDPDEAVDPEPLVEVAFTSQRPIMDQQAATLQLGASPPRLVLGDDAQGGVSSDELPKLGGVGRNVEITPLAITSSATPKDDRPKTLTIPQAPAVLELSQNSTGVPDADSSDADETDGETIQSTVSDEEQLTVFGARNKTENDRGSHRLGLLLGLVLVGLVVAAALLSGIFISDGQIASVFPPETATEPEAVQSVVEAENSVPASPGFAIEQTLSLGSDVEPGFDTASLYTPDLSTDLMMQPTPEEAQEELSAPSISEPELTPELAQKRYVETGIWQMDPIAPIDPDADRLDNLYVASIDTQIAIHDAVALPPADQLQGDTHPKAQATPAPSGTVFDLDERGLVRATPGGSATPEGILVFAGTPPLTPAPRPSSGETFQPAEVADNRLAGIRPRARPGDLVEKTETAQLGGRTRVELAALRPRARPGSPQDQDVTVDTTPTAQAVLSSRAPATRPANFVKIVAKARRAAPTDDSVVLASAGAVATPQLPSIPTRANVAQEATIKNAINLSKVNLIGVYGSSVERRALVRLASGRYIKVQVGDRVDGGKVAAISADELRYIKGGRNVILKLPKEG